MDCVNNEVKHIGWGFFLLLFLEAPWCGALLKLPWTEKVNCEITAQKFTEGIVWPMFRRDKSSNLEPPSAQGS